MKHNSEMEEKNKQLKAAISLLKSDKLDECEALLESLISRYSHSPEPHNLFGILYEKMGQHALAMKYFRAALDFDPNYLPARHNLDHYGTFYSKGFCAYEEKDCLECENGEGFQVEYNENHIGHIFRRR